MKDELPPEKAETFGLQPAPAPRGRNGRFQAGDTSSLRHGGRSARVAAGLMPEQAEAAAALEDNVAAIVSDLGGPESLSAIAAGQALRHGRMELAEDYLWQVILDKGPLTPSGRPRAALKAWLSVVDRLQKSATALGLERRSKPVNPLDAVRAAVIEANR